ncbi:MAG: mechanosensitive ion channel family protein, partial [Sulfuricurvum sp.]
MKFYAVLLAFVLAVSLHGAPKPEDTPQEQTDARESELRSVQEELSKIQKELARDNSIWIKSYNSYMAYQEARKSLRDVKSRIDQLQNHAPSIERKLETEA